ncbi:erv26 super protein [Malassezia cuniculi]|uniref:Erv26 super protein n=1 Tax=Malassezia cuniculi TaxID=948313 RepID=A0AAF0JB59_9BASI|nr:erv26 super protein [Malassezia cuniculi]
MHAGRGRLCGTWIEGHSRIARRLAQYYAFAQAVLQLAFFASGYIPTGAYALCSLALAHHIYILRDVSWPTHEPSSTGALRLLPSVILPAIAHVKITSYYAAAAGDWAVHRQGWAQEPSSPNLKSHDVVALLAGSVWTLPVWLFLGESAAEWALPTQ